MDKTLQNEFDWLQVRHKIQEVLTLNKLPDLNAVLLFVGIQELGKWKSSKTRKEEKQDLMHIGVCTLLSLGGYYQWDGLDSEGWPHFAQLKKFEIRGVDEQEIFLKQKAIEYFNNINI